MKANNAIIMAAGTASRFAPLSYEKPKALIEVNGEILIERQIRQLREAEITEIIVITGYMADKFEYLADKYNVLLKYNGDYLNRNNNSSIYVAREYLSNSFICSSDNYYCENPFTREYVESSYTAVYVEGKTDEWCITEANGIIDEVSIGGRDSWIMMGHSFWTEEFSRKFISILLDEYNRPETANKLWETIYIEHIDELHMEMDRFSRKSIFEFDTLDELREFDSSYIDNTRSGILKQVANELGIAEREIVGLKALKENSNCASGFEFSADKRYRYYYKSHKLEEVIC